LAAGFQTVILYGFLIGLRYATCPAHLIFLDLHHSNNIADLHYLWGLWSSKTHAFNMVWKKWGYVTHTA